MKILLYWIFKIKLKKLNTVFRKLLQLPNYIKSQAFNIIIRINFIKIETNFKKFDF